MRRELDEAWDRREKSWKAWREAKGTAAERGRRKEFARAGWVLNLLEREGVQRGFDAHARGLERLIRLRRMANAKAMRSDNLPAELLKLGVRASSHLLTAFHGIILRIWQERTVPQLWKDAVI